MNNRKEKPHRYSGREFSEKQIQTIRDCIASPARLNRAQLSRKICAQFNWRSANGKLKEMSSRVALLKMHRAGLITLPAPQKSNGNGRIKPKITPQSDAHFPINQAIGKLEKLELVKIKTREQSRYWNELIERYHYLGYKPLPGAQIRYFIYWQKQLLAVIGFGAAAWKVACRDRHIGWSAEKRQTNLHLIVNNARFLILPWVNSPNLASQILSKTAKALPEDWQEQYGYKPVLLETYVERAKFRGTSYKAANWHYVGQTKGRGKLDTKHLNALPIKDVLIYPLNKQYRKKLTKKQ